jgi:hypothetical protein
VQETPSLDIIFFSPSLIVTFTTYSSSFAPVVPYIALVLLHYMGEPEAYSLLVRMAKVNGHYFPLDAPGWTFLMLDFANEFRNRLPTLTSRKFSLSLSLCYIITKPFLIYFFPGA